MDRKIPCTSAAGTRTGRARPRRHVLVVAALASLVLTAVGCSDDEDAAAQEVAASSTTESDTTTTAATPSEPNDDEDEPATGAPSDPRVVPAGEAPTVTFGDDTMHCLATAGDTGGGYSLLDIRIPTGSGPQQQQSSADQWFFFLDGTASVEIGDLATDVASGDYVHVPRDTTFTITATTDVRLLAGFAPGGFESVFGCPS